MKFRTMGTSFATSLAVLGVLAGPALAQSSSSHSATSNSAAPSEGRPGGTGLSTNTNTTSPGTANGMASSDSSRSGSSLMGDRVQQVHGAYLSSKLVGATVYNDHKDSIGSIDNLMIDPSGKITQAVISVGGFLGVGSKLVEVPFSELQFQQDSNGNGRKVTLPSATQQSLKAMQEFTYNG